MQTVLCQPVHQTNLALVVLRFVHVKKTTLKDVILGLVNVNAWQDGQERRVLGLVPSTDMERSAHLVAIARMGPSVIPSMEIAYALQVTQESSAVNIVPETNMGMTVSLTAAAKIRLAVHTNLGNVFVNQVGKGSGVH